MADEFDDFIDANAGGAGDFDAFGLDGGADGGFSMEDLGSGDLGADLGGMPTDLAAMPADMPLDMDMPADAGLDMPADPMEAMELPADTGLAAPAPAMDAGFGGGYGEPVQGDVFADPTPLQLWEQERVTILAEREAASDVKKQEVVAAAAEQLAKFYAARDEKIAATKKQNREDAERSTATMTQLMEHGTKWEKVDKLCDLKPKQDKKSGTERMRKLLITLKNEVKEEEKTA